MQRSDKEGKSAEYGVLVSWGCHNKAPQSGWLKQQKCTASTLWRLEVYN